ncbi:MAG: hypothetical protein ACTSYL_03275 [Candidatus Thorarchaeota archaeon]
MTDPCHTSTLLANEIRQMWNQFKRSLTTPSMLMFYSIMLAGAFFVSWTLSFLGTAIYIESRLASLLVELVNIENVLSILGFMTAGAVIGGYLGLGPAAVLQPPDEYILMPAPLRPHQVFLSRYVRRVIRKGVYLLMALLILQPILTSLQVSNLAFIALFGAFIIYLETNYMLSGVAFYLRKLSKRIARRLVRYFFLSLLPLAIIIATLPMFNTNSVSIMLVFSNLVGLLLLHILGLVTVNPIQGVALGVGLWFFGLYLLVATFSTQDYYEAFTSRQTKVISESRIWRIIHGEIDFSTTRFNDPMMWVILKDFWSRMRMSTQFWKYVSALVGTIGALLLWMAPTNILPPLNVNPVSIAPAFMILLLLVIQMASLSALLSFVDEKENVYLLKASPFKRTDIVLAKYVGSVLDSAISLVPLLLFIGYGFREFAIEPLLVLVGPLLLVFCASGVMIGAYVPVLTNEPQNPPIPLVFSYPTLNLVIGGAFSLFVINSPGDIIFWVIPLFTIGFVFLFIMLATRALRLFK